MRVLLALLLLTLSPLCLGASMVSTAWSNLWRTQDQQAQALLEAGQAAQAADRFRDPQRRAYADLQAGRYADAAKLLAPFKDPESEYNRGNALAKAGELQAAVTAYDAALEQAPADRDIRHNRDLVARALQQRQQPQPSPKGGQGGQKSGSSGQQQSGGNRQNGSGAQQPGAQGKPPAGSGQQASNGAQGAHQPGNSGQQQLGRGSDRNGARTPQGADPNATSKESPGEARRDAEEAAAALARQQRQGKGNAAQALGQSRNGTPQPGAKAGGKDSETPGRLAAGTQTPKQQAESERQLALDQWLRQIPDSPAGLLQRKFLIEHMVRQQGTGDPPQDGP
jgi:Ca-activated chloride channel family protein